MANTARDLIKCRISNAPGILGGFNVLGAAAGFLTLESGDTGLPFKLNITENGVGTEIRKNCIYTHSTASFTRGTMVRSTGANDAELNFTSAAIISVVPSAEDSLTAEQAAAITVFSAPVGIMEQCLLADGAKISAAVYDASYFGFQAATRTWPTPMVDLIASAPDSSSAARNLETFFTNWATSSKQPVVIRFGPGVYKFDAITFAQNAEVYYPTNGFTIQGAGSGSTYLCATVSSKAQFIGLSGKTNWTRVPNVQGITFVGAGVANPYQVGVFLNPDFATSLGFGGLTSANWNDVGIHGFAREQLWLKGGSENYLIPVQFSAWEDIVLETSSATYPALRLTGQIGTPFNFKTMQCYGASNTPAIAAIGLDTRTGITLSQADATTNTLIFSTPHRFKTSDRFTLPAVSGTAWGGLSLDTDYWAYRIDDFSIKVCNSYANAIASTPTFVTLSSTTGTATVSSKQVAGINISPGNVIFETLTLQRGVIGMDVTGTSLVFINHLHGEETDCQVRVSSQAVANINHAAHGNSANNSGILYDASSGGQIHLTGMHAVSGNVGKLLAGANGSVSGPDQWVGTLYKTTGSGISGKTSGYMQLGNDAEIALGQRVNGEYILNTGTVVVQHISAQSFIGQRVMFRIWPATGNWIEFGVSGNLTLHNKAVIGSPATLRIPVQSFITFVCTSLNEGWSLDSLELPVHSVAWTLSGNVSANSNVSTTVTCPGARVGDISPAVSVSAVLTAGLILVAEVTATDTVTVRIVNPTTSALASPTNPTVYVRQQR